MSRVEYSGNVVQMNGESVTFEHDVKDAFEYENLIIVLLNPPTDVDNRRNVHAISPTCERAWRIETPTTKDVTGAVVYTSVYIDDGSLIARTWGGDEYTVDPETGKIDYRRFVK